MSDIIAWLVPTARGSYADRATHSPSNTTRSVSIASSSFLSGRLPDLLPSSRPQKAIALCFDQTPRRPGSFILGSDPRTCDVVLPKLPGVSAQHCSLGFDGQNRLVLDDFSERGTQVWYDWESTGDQADSSWVLSAGCLEGAFPGNVRRITIDIQGVRFQLVVNDFSADWDAYRSKVDAFCAQPEWMDWVDDTTIAPSCLALAPAAPVFSAAAAPLFQHIFVKALGDEPVGEFYVWNLSRPWEPMVRATA